MTENSYRFVVVVQSLSHIRLCEPMDCSSPGFPLLYYFLEFAQTHVPWVSDAIQPSCPLSSPSPPAFSLSHHQGLFQWIGSSHQMARVLELQLQHQSFQWLFSYFPLGLTGVILQTIRNLLPDHNLKASVLWRSGFFMVQLSRPYMTTENTIALTIQIFVGKVMSL